MNCTNPTMLRREKKAWSKSVDLDDEDFDPEYFTYRPLSNLPTPPPSSRNSSAKQSPRNLLADGECLKPKFLGPAIHLVNLIPAAASLATPSVPLVQAILTRANLPIETIALAVCVLDALDSKFSLSWRLSCPLVGGPASQKLQPEPSKRHTLPASPAGFDLAENSHSHGHTGNHGYGNGNGSTSANALAALEQPLHIDSVSPELIILSALVIAVKFLEDPHSSAHHFCTAWGGGIWSCVQLNVTETCIMENLGWRIMPLYDDELLTDAMVDMQLAVRQRPAPESWYGEERKELTPEDSDAEDEEDVSARRASEALGLGLQLTPPSEEVLEEHFRDLGRATTADADR